MTDNTALPADPSDLSSASSDRKRKLAVIMFTDIKGYSAMMGSDEDGTLALLEQHNAIVGKEIDRFGGRVIKTIGDAFLVDFDSVVAALNCAVAMQKSLAKFNAELPSGAQQLLVRIGIHAGDVVYVGNDVFGDGVNIAARLESQAEPGGICVSEEVYKLAQNRVPVDLHFAGERKLKNIERPVRVYMTGPATAPTITQPRRRHPAIAVLSILAALVGGSIGLYLFFHRGSVPSGASAPGTTAPPAPASKAVPPAPAESSKPLLAVMSFDDKTGEPSLHEAGINRILSDAFVQTLYDTDGVYVVSPVRMNSVLASLRRPFEDSGRDLSLAKEICSRTGARLVLLGSLSRLGKTYLLNATLTEFPGENLVGSFESRSRSPEELLDAGTSVISAKLRSCIAALYSTQVTGGRSAASLATSNLEAYTHFIRGRDLVNEGNWPAAVDELKKAVTMDPQMAVAWSALGCAYSFNGNEAQSKAADSRALAFRSRLSEKERSWVEATSLWLEGGGKRYVDASEAFIRKYPDDRDGFFYAGLGEQWLLKDYRRALEFYRQARELTPNYYPITKDIAECYVALGDKGKAEEALQQYIATAQAGHGLDQAKVQLASLR